MYPHDNIFNIYYNIGKRTPFVVKRCEVGLRRSLPENRYSKEGRTFLVEDVKPRGKYGHAYGHCMIDGVVDDNCEYMQYYKDKLPSGEIPCAGCGEWVLLDVPGVNMEEIFPKKKGTDIIAFGKYKGKTYQEVYELDAQYLTWLESTDPYFKIDYESIK